MIKITTEGSVDAFVINGDLWLAGASSRNSHYNAFLEEDLDFTKDNFFDLKKTVWTGIEDVCCPSGKGLLLLYSNGDLCAVGEDYEGNLGTNGKNYKEPIVVLSNVKKVQTSRRLFSWSYCFNK